MPPVKSKPDSPRLHPRNRNRDRYDVAALVACLPALAAFVKKSKSGDDTIDFTKPEAVKLLNRALILHNYGLETWDFPDKNLCPPVPGRADYVHYIADVLRENHFGTIPEGLQTTCLDVGVGASAIYPIVGIVEYGWSFIGSDVSEESLTSAEAIKAGNPGVLNNLDLRIQPDGKRIFHGMLKPTDRIDAVLCNPPFHSSAEDAIQGTLRKTRNLTGGQRQSPMLNFSGISKELIFEGGEVKFIQTMMRGKPEFLQKRILVFLPRFEAVPPQGAVPRIESDQARRNQNDSHGNRQQVHTHCSVDVPIERRAQGVARAEDGHGS